MCLLIVDDYSRACQREKGKKKEEEEKSPEKTTLPWPGLEPTDSVSRAKRAIHYAMAPNLQSLNLALSSIIGSLKAQ